MPTAYIISVFLHILAAMVWIGGALFLVFVLVPVIRTPDLRAHAPRLLQLSGRRFKIVGWISLSVLLVTGLLNLHYRGWFAAMKMDGFWGSPTGQVLAIKLILVGVILLLSLVHDFYIGPRAVDLLRSAPGEPEALRWRKAASWFGRVNVLLGIVVVLMAVLFVRGIPL